MAVPDARDNKGTVMSCTAVVALPLLWLGGD
jgi:hypothetical protein